MPYISADEFTNPILKKIASGDESIFSDAEGDEFNVTETTSGLRMAWRPLSLSCNNGHAGTVEQLLGLPGVLANAAASGNNALCRAAACGHLNIVNRLLEIPKVLDNAAAVSNLALRMAVHRNHRDVVNRLLDVPIVKVNSAFEGNYVLRWAANHGYLNLVNKLLEIPLVAATVASRNNFALCSAAQNSHSEVAYTLASMQWPRGVIDMPTDLRKCLPAIHQGAIIASGKKEFEDMTKCWIRGKPTNTTSEIHHPRHDEYTVAIRVDDGVALNIMQYAGCRNVIKEAANEDVTTEGINTLLYSSRLHKTFKAAYEAGQKEKKKRSGYGEGAMTIYRPNKSSKSRSVKTQPTTN